MTNAKEGQTYVCTKADRPWWTAGKEYEVLVTSKGKELLVDDDGDRWQINDLKNNHCELKLNLHAEFKLKETHVETEKHNYTRFDVNKIIIKAYQTYNNDAQRMAFIKGYFAE